MYFEQFLEQRNIKKQTIKSYKSTVKKFTEYHQTTFDELIEEAMDEEDLKIPKRKRNIKARFIDFRTYLLTHQKLKTSTIQNHMTNLKAIYNYFNIELPELPKLNNKNHGEITYLDLPNKKDISRAIKSTGIRLKSLILVMASSGIARNECVNLTIGDFIKGCEGYYTAENLPDIIEELYYSIEDIIPTLSVYREKTEKTYYAFCTPQATQAVLEWLMLRVDMSDEKLNMKDSLWDWSLRQVTYQFNRLNDELEFGYNKDGYRFFRPHALRKFNGSNIGLSPETVDLLHGRSKSKIHEAYIKTNPNELKKIYMEAMENVIIKDSYKKEIHHDEFIINLNLNFFGNEYGVSI